ncbi:MAG: mftF [Frankiales bacterium]|nr:mftF [Frankiales bacterium]
MTVPDALPLVLDAQVRLLAGGRVLLGGDPVRLLRLRTASAVWSSPRRTPAERQLVRRLLDEGLVHPDPAPGDAPVTVVVPVRDRTGALARLLEALGGRTPVLVVDDGSLDPGAVAEVCRVHDARLLRLDTSLGPGGARDAGLAATSTRFVALLDSDCVPAADWLPRLLAHFADPAVVAVAPRVRSRLHGSVLGRYAHARGPLDLGPRPARVRPGSRVSYVPTAALVVRRSALPDGPAFDPALRYGEDVDLVWRLHDAGGTVRYDPDVVVEHEDPDRWGAWLRRRHQYGTSAAPLAVRHPDRLAPLVLSPWVAAGLVLLLAGRPGGAAAAATVPVARLHRRLVQAGVPHLPAAAASVGTVGRGLLSVLGSLGSGGSVVALPVLAGLLLPARTSRPAAALLLTPPLVEAWQRRPDLDVVRWSALRLLDEAAYASGVWRGCWRVRSTAALRPRGLLGSVRP